MTTRKKGAKPKTDEFIVGGGINLTGSIEGDVVNSGKIIGQIKPQADELSAGVILVAFEKLFGGGRGVQRFKRSGLRYVKLPSDAILIEQNPQRKSKWAKLAQQGLRIAWVMRDGEYLARVVDGEVTTL
jgi:hypothetical protein